MDIWDLKYHFELAVSGAAPECSVEPATDGAVGWEAVQRAGGGVVGWAGPLEADAPVWAAPLFGFEVRLTAAQRSLVAYRPLPLQPPVERDVALVLPPGATAAQVSDILRRTVGPLLERLEVFDEYRGPGVPVGQRSVAWHCTFRDPARTRRARAVKAEGELKESGGRSGGAAAKPDAETRNRVADMEQENKTLRQRVEAARLRVHDLLSRLTFLEEQARETGGNGGVRSAGGAAPAGGSAPGASGGAL